MGTRRSCHPQDPEAFPLFRTTARCQEQSQRAQQVICGGKGTTRGSYKGSCLSPFRSLNKRDPGLPLSLASVKRRCQPEGRGLSHGGGCPWGSEPPRQFRARHWGSTDLPSPGLQPHACHTASAPPPTLRRGGHGQSAGGRHCASSSPDRQAVASSLRV